MEQEHLKSVIESLLFVSNKPLKAKDFSKQLEIELPDIHAALDSLMTDRKTSGVVILENNGEYQMATNSSNSTQVKNFLNAELREKLTDATVEVLAIIAYRQPISKAEIEAIRGVNSQYSIRHLLMRGMIEKVANPNDARGFLYQTTTEFLQHMGLTSVKDLPDFQTLVSQIKLPETPAIAAADTAENMASEQVIENSESPTGETVTPTETTEQALMVIAQEAEEIIESSALPEDPMAAEPTAEPQPSASDDELEEDEDEFDDEDEDDDEA